MRRLLILFCLLPVLPAFSSQLEIQVRAPKDTFLVYEAIPVTVTVHNSSGRAARLEESGGKSWLSFLITDEGSSLVRALAEPETREPVLIPPGQSVSRTIDLLPLYELRSRGSYRVQAMLNAAGASSISSPMPLTLTQGRELWSRVVGLPVGDGATEQYRTYSLLARRGQREDSLYVSVRDEPREVVYSLVELGSFLSTAPPQTLVDGEGRLHVLFQNGPRSFGYAGIDSSAKVLTRAAYSDFRSSPQLSLADGKVEVRGGEQTYPPLAQASSAEKVELAPPTKPKEKRRWWWPFGQRS